MSAPGRDGDLQQNKLATAADLDGLGEGSQPAACAPPRSANRLRAFSQHDLEIGPGPQLRDFDTLRSGRSQGQAHTASATLEKNWPYLLTPCRTTSHC